MNPVIVFEADEAIWLSAYIPYGLSLTMYDGKAFDGDSKNSNPTT